MYPNHFFSQMYPIELNNLTYIVIWMQLCFPLDFLKNVDCFTCFAKELFYSTQLCYCSCILKVTISSTFFYFLQCCLSPHQPLFLKMKIDWSKVGKCNSKNCNQEKSDYCYTRAVLTDTNFMISSRIFITQFVVKRTASLASYKPPFTMKALKCITLGSLEHHMYILCSTVYSLL